MADPPTAYASLVRRDNIRGVTRHMHGGQYGQVTIEGMEEFFENWTKASPLIFCKYEALHDHLGDIGAALGVSFEGFPKRKQRKSRPTDAVDRRLLALRQRFNDLPDFFVRPAHLRLLDGDGS